MEYKESKDIIQLLSNCNPFNPYKAVSIYQYGSHVYGTAGPQSDFDIIMVSPMEESYNQFHWQNLNCTVFSIKEFEQRLIEHDITMLECMFLPCEFIVKDKRQYNFEISKYVLRHSVSKKASNSFVKAKKKLTVEKSFNPYVAKKSLFHSLRIPIFGKQLAEFGKIVDYSAANHYWPQIRDCGHEDWSYYKKKYQPVFNNLMSDFRRVAPK
jgi:predicted nucleotidyltransferase